MLDKMIGVLLEYAPWCDLCRLGPGDKGRRLYDDDEWVDCPECHAWADGVATAVLDAVKG